MRTWRVGEFTVTEVQEFPVAVGLLDGLIAEATPEVVQGIDWMIPDYANEAGQTLWDVHSYVVDTGEQVILVDAGCGNGKSYPMQPSWSGLDTAFLARLEEAGYGRGDIDIVLCTHLHLDHVGWCSMQDEDGRWVPTFPNARLVLVREEYERHLGLMIESVDEHAAPEPSAVVDDDADRIARAFLADATSLSEQTKLIQRESFQPVIDAGRLHLVPANAEIVPGVRYESTPGHTSAHHSVRLESDGASAFITGDFIHHPIQIARPEWSSQGDWDGEASARNRRAFFESCAGTDLLVLGTHFTGPGAGYIVEDGTEFRLVETKPAARNVPERSLQQRLDAIEDRFAIVDLLCKYAVSIDRHRWDDFEALFTEEVDVDLIRTDGWVRFQRPELRKLVQGVFESYSATQHISANHQVTVDGDHAVAWSTLNATHYLKDAADGEFHQQVGYYEYHLTRGHGWRITKIRQLEHWQRGNQQIFDRTVR